MPLLNERITELAENTAPAPDDYVPHVDRSDTSMAISGTTKFSKWGTVWKAFQTWVFAEDAGANDTYTATLTPAPDAYVTGQHYRFKANTANTGACTINFNGLGAKAIKKAAGGITTDLADNDIHAGQWVDLVYDGTNMQMQSQLGASFIRPDGSVAFAGDQSMGSHKLTNVTDPASAQDAATKAYVDSTVAGGGGAPGGSAGGDLSGTYPNPTINPDASALSPAFEVLTDGATITWALGSDRVRNAKVTLGGNRTLSITGAVDGAQGVLIVKQDATGSRTLTLPAGSVVVGGGSGAITLSTAANAVDVLSFYYDGTNYFWTFGKNFT